MNNSRWAVVRTGWLSMPLLSAVLCGCGGGPPRVFPPSIDAEAASLAAMEQYDANNDGRVAGGELAAAPSLRSAKGNLDQNGDEAITSAEIANLIRAWQETKVARNPVACTVRYRGKPLSGATVTFDPEAFLGSNLVPATGVTNEYGFASLSLATQESEDDVAGVPCGLYLVRVTHDRLDLPAEFNTATKLGQEVSVRAAGLYEGLSFELH